MAARRQAQGGGVRGGKRGGRRVRSTPTPQAAGNSVSAASSRQPVPVPRSSMRPDAARAGRRARPRSASRCRRAGSASPGRPRSRRLQNSWRPRMRPAARARRAGPARRGKRPRRSRGRVAQQALAARARRMGEQQPGFARAATRCRRPPSAARRRRAAACADRHRLSLLRRQPRRLVLGGQRVDDLVEVALHDPVDIVEREVDAVVGDPALREIVGADALAAVAGADLALAVGGAGGVRGWALRLRRAGRAGSSSPWRGSCAGSAPPAWRPRCRSEYG